MRNEEKAYREKMIKRLNQNIDEYKERAERLGWNAFDTEIEHLEKLIKWYKNDKSNVPYDEDSFTVGF